MKQSFAKSLNRFRLLSLSGTLQTAGRFIRKQLWAWPIIAALLFGGIGWWVHSTVESTLRRQMGDHLQTMLNADVTALRTWMGEQAGNAQIMTLNEGVFQHAQELVAVEAKALEAKAAAIEQPLLQAKAQAELRACLAPRMKVFGYVDFFLVSPSGRVLASGQSAPVGRTLSGYQQEFFQAVLTGQPSVSRPFRSILLLPDEHGDLKAGLPTMFAAAPLRDATGKPFAVLAMRIRPDGKFTEIIRVARAGQTGETYAFDRHGLLISQSRFDEELKRLGLLVDQPEVKSILTLELRDPQVNMVEGERSPLRRHEQPLTHAAAEAAAGRSGVDTDGYRDYRGVMAIGAWAWLPEYDFGMATEMDLAEAYQPLYVLRVAFWSLMGLLVLSGVAIFFFMLIVARQQVAVQKAVLAAKQLGQYALEEKIGSGGMGSVYKAKHALLRRPTAIKLLDPDKISDVAIARFEREVQLTSQLTHPNTIAIYDYGRTPEGVFFYAMEYLDGINLEDLVVRHGPLPEGRVVSILKQVCGSLAEAHSQGLIHRDIKPANILLNHRGGVADFVKVLDFGLAKAMGAAKQARLTSDASMVGTPLYLAPETIQQGSSEPDARADIYAVGAVGYFLLTGAPPFEGKTIMETFMLHITAPPQPPSERRGRYVSAPLESLILRGLNKDPKDRPATAKVMLEALDQCHVSEAWTDLQAEVWWTQFKAGTLPPTSATVKETGVVGQTMEYDSRAG